MTALAPNIYANAAGRRAPRDTASISGGATTSSCQLYRAYRAASASTRRASATVAGLLTLFPPACARAACRDRHAAHATLPAYNNCFCLAIALPWTSALQHTHFVTCP